MKLLEQFKRKKYRPEFEENNARVLSQEVEVEEDGWKTCQIVVGHVKKRGKDLPSGKNLADYVDKLGRFEMLKFYADHKTFFPVLWIQSQCEESR